MRLTKMCAAVALSGCIYLLSTPQSLALDSKAKNVRAESSNTLQTKAGSTMKSTATIYDFSAKALDGHEIKLSEYKDHPLLIVNTASQCGFTPQYEGLEGLYKKFSGKGFRILGFPCNQFGGQEPGNSQEISNFCKKNYGVTFQMFEKIDVNGKDAHPLYKYLVSEKPGMMDTEAIKWNFTKFLVSKDGHVVKRYAPNVKPEDIAADIQAQL